MSTCLLGLLSCFTGGQGNTSQQQKQQKQHAAPNTLASKVSDAGLWQQHKAPSPDHNSSHPQPQQQRSSGGDPVASRMSTSNPLFSVLNHPDMAPPSSSGADSVPANNISTVADATPFLDARLLEGRTGGNAALLLQDPTGLAPLLLQLSVRVSSSLQPSNTFSGTAVLTLPAQPAGTGRLQQPQAALAADGASSVASEAGSAHVPAPAEPADAAGDNRDVDEGLVSCAESFTSAVSTLSMTESTSTHLAAALLALEKVQHTGPRGVTPRKGWATHQPPSRAMQAARTSSSVSTATTGAAAGAASTAAPTPQHPAHTGFTRNLTQPDLQPPQGPDATGPVQGQPTQQPQPTQQQQPAEAAGGTAAAAGGDEDVEFGEGRSSCWAAEAAAVHADMLRTAARLYRQHGHPCGSCQEILGYVARHDVSYEDLEQAVALVVTRSSIDGLQPHTTTHHPAPSAASASAATAAGAAVATAGSWPLCSVPMPATGAAAPEPPALQSQGSLRGGLMRKMREDLERLVRAARQMSIAVLKVLDDSDWQVVLDDMLKMMYQHHAGTTVHSFKGRCTLESPVENLVALAREFDLCKTWNHYCTESVVIKEHSPAELLAVATAWLPWPLPNMNMVVEAVGTNLLDMHGGFLITFSTPAVGHDPELKAQMPASIRNNPHLTLMQGSCIFLEPLPPSKPGSMQRTRATMEVRVDPGLKHVPSFLITFVLKVLGPFVYNIVVKLLKKEFSDPTKPLPARIPTRPQLYGLVREHADEYLSEMQRKGVPLPQPLKLAAVAATAHVGERGSGGSLRARRTAAVAAAVVTERVAAV